MADPFSPITINGMELANRFMRSATFDGMAENGQATDDQVDLFRRLARGGVGLIVSGLIAVSADGGLSPRQNGLYQDSQAESLARVCRAVHAAGGKVAAQLAHAGRESFKLHLNRPDDPPAGPSPVEGGPAYTGRCRGLSTTEIEDIIAAFGAAAGRAKAAGFDAVQLHAAHAYLPAQFLSPLANQRDDQWGGTPENRLRFHRQVLSAMRAAVGPGYPILVKLGLADGPAGGLSLEEGLASAAELARAGFDSLEISQGLRGQSWDETEFRVKLSPQRRNYFADWAARAKALVDKPVAMVGGLRDLASIRSLLADGAADLAAISRPLIQQPDLVARWRDDPTLAPGCVSCNKCLALLRAGRPLACGVTDQAAKEFLKKQKTT